MKPSVKDEALHYARLGMSVLPTRADKRPFTRTQDREPLTPDGGWKFAQRGVAEPQEIESWYRRAPHAGVGIVCGSVSGNLVVLDIDYLPLCDWIRENTNLLDTTWVVQTGSGKLHIYMRSRQPAYTAGINSSEGIHLAEVRADGRPPFESSYVVAPPSSYDFKGTKGSYHTLAGSPEDIRLAEDASGILSQLVKQGYAQLNGKSGDLRMVDRSGQETTSVMPPGDEEELRKLVHDLHLPGKVRRAITKGAKPQDGEWKNCQSNSEIDHAVAFTLREREVDHETIEKIFATLPVGEACYRNLKRSNHGRRYLAGDLQKIDDAIAARKVAAADNKGEDFEVISVKKTGGDKSVYEALILRFDTGVKGLVKITPEELNTESSFRTACDRSMNFRPTLTKAQSSSWQDFARMINRMSTVEYAPMDATEFGYLASNTWQALREGLLTEPPANPEVAVLGWRDDAQQMAVVYPRALIQKMGQRMRPSPNPTRVWDVLRSVGAEEEFVTVGERSINTWRIPLKAIEQE